MDVKTDTCNSDIAHIELNVCERERERARERGRERGGERERERGGARAREEMKRETRANIRERELSAIYDGERDWS